MIENHSSTYNDTNISYTRSVSMNIKTVLTGICIILCSAGYSCTSTEEKKAFPPTTGILLEESSADWGTVIYNTQYRLINNVWNKSAATGSYIQRVFTETLNGKTAVGWQWNWTNSSYSVVAYPEIVIGDKPWDTAAGISTPFPVAAGSADIVADFKTNITATGVYNMAFSIWGFTNTSDPRNSITHEIMIWVLNNGLSPAGTKQYTTTIDGVEFDVYVKENHGDDSGGASNKWTYIAFEPQSDIKAGPFHLDDFIDFLASKSLITSANYLSSVELGNEVVRGSGSVEIEDYAITVTPR